MEYKNITEEQRKSMTPYLKEKFDLRLLAEGCDMQIFYNKQAYKIQAFQQAQKEEIKFLERIHKELIYWECPVFLLTKNKIKQLKFESELI